MGRLVLNHSTNLEGLIPVLQKLALNISIKTITPAAISRVRGKYSGTNLFGGGAPNYSDLLSEGNADKEKLETKLYEGVPGFGDGQPPLFFVG